MGNDAETTARRAGLIYVDRHEPGHTRRRRGRGFSYHRHDGSLVHGDERRRIEELVIPPAWDDVWICPNPDGHLLATGVDQAGRVQYQYHPDFRAAREREKFDRMADFGAGLPDLRRHIEDDLDRKGLAKTRVHALAARILDRGLIRIGNDESANENGAFGLTTLRAEHADVSDEKVVFEFAGKGQGDRQVEFTDPAVARLLNSLLDLDAEELLAYRDQDGVIRDVTSEGVNAYLSERAGVTAKDFRTWGASRAAVAVLGPLTAGGVGEDDEDDEAILEAIDAAAELLGDTRAVCRSSYVHPDIATNFTGGGLAEQWRRSRTSRWMDRSERTLVRILT